MKSALKQIFSISLGLLISTVVILNKAVAQEIELQHRKSGAKLAKLNITNNEKYIRFTVQDVIQSQTSLKVLSFEAVMTENFIRNSEVLFSDDPPKEKKTTPSPIYFHTEAKNLIESNGTHPFIYALSRAYAEHRAVTISPDMIWLLINQGFADHVNRNSEKLRNLFVDFSGKKNIHVEVPSAFDLESDKDWEGALDLFVKKIGENTKSDVKGALSMNFSTTTSTEKAAFDITIMDSMESYFTYSMSPLCGIPEITVEGTLEDWQAILQRLDVLGKFELEWWTNDLKRVIEQILKTRSGNIDQSFWADMFQLRSKSVVCTSVPYMTGWALIFFPYLSDGAKNPYITSAETKPKFRFSDKGKEDQEDIVEFEDLPDGIARVELLVYTSKNDKFRWMELCAGFVGVSQDSISMSLRPEISWGVVATGKEVTDEDRNQFLNR